jgi:putative SOS response-associated peptidase YedK
MCNDYERQIEWEAYKRAVEAAHLGIPATASSEQLAPVDDTRVGDTAPVMIQSGNAVDLVPMRWGFTPAGAGRPPVFNFRSEGRSFAKSKRCLIPASAFFEFTGKQSPKSKWRFELRAEPVLAIAGLWRTDDSGAAFTMLTTAPGPDVAPFHDRQVAVLSRRDWGAWLYLERPEAELLVTLPPDSLRVSLTRSGKEPPPAELLSRVE